MAWTQRMGATLGAMFGAIAEWENVVFAVNRWGWKLVSVMQCLCYLGQVI